MTGSLQTKSGKFYVVLNLYTPEGKRKPKWIATGLEVKGNKRRAEAILRQTIQEYEQMAPMNGGEKLFSEAIKDWLEEARLHIDEVTLQGYTTLAKTHVIPYFESRKTRLCDVTWQLRTLLEVAKDEAIFPALKITAVYGLRRSGTPGLEVGQEHTAER